MDDVARLILSVAFLLLAVFTTGAALGWRWEARGERAKREPGWIFVLMEFTWLVGILVIFLSGEGWLTAITFVLWAAAFVLRLRYRLSGRGTTP
jgi:hypothetical protein